MPLIALFGIPILVIAVGLFLLSISIIDIKLKEIPKILTSAVILVLLMVNMQNIAFGIIAAMFGLLLLEIGKIGGVADIKALAILGLMVSNIFQLFIFLIIVSLVGMFYEIIMEYIFKKKHKEDLAYIPIYFITFILMNVIQFTFA